MGATMNATELNPHYLLSAISYQWRDARATVYGLTFTSKEDAEGFASQVEEAIRNLQNPAPPVRQSSVGFP